MKKLILVSVVLFLGLAFSKCDQISRLKSDIVDSSKVDTTPRVDTNHLIRIIKLKVDTLIVK